MKIDCRYKNKHFQKTIISLRTIENFVLEHKAREYWLLNRQSFNAALCMEHMEYSPIPQLFIGDVGYELKTLHTLEYLLADSVGKQTPIYLLIGNCKFEVKINGYVPNW